VGLRFRTIRAAASALLVAAAVGTGGMAGMTSVLAADPAMVGLAGTVVNHDGGRPLAGIPLVITELVLPDGGAVAVQTVTGPDGTFAVDLQAMGTADAPATVTIKAPADALVEVIGDTCSETFAVAMDPGQDITLSGAAPERLTLEATTTLIGEVCGTTGVPSTGNSGDGPAGGSAGGSAGLTPPPTDAFAAPMAAGPVRLGPAVTIGFFLGIVGAAALLLPRPRARRRD
jgi:hypothetical protein